jgi:uncharacterized low-complexity protein
MNTKQLFRNLAIILAFSIGAFTFYSFTTKANVIDKNNYDQLLYQDLEANSSIFNFTEATNGDKCGTGKCGDDKKKDADAKKDKDSKCGDGKCGDDKKAADKKCGDGKCGGDKAKDEKKEGEDKKADEDKDAKCGTGKCG